MDILVLAGGTSTERDISIVSGTGICTALREKGHHAVLVDIFGGVEDVDWSDPFPAEYDVEAANRYMKSFDSRIEEIRRTRRSFWGPNVLALCEKAQIVFLGLHGMNGEDGRVQATFDLMGIPYTGTGYLSSGIAMNKGLTKLMFQAGGIPTPWSLTVQAGHPAIEAPEKAGLEFPIVVKTCCGGSSVGVYITRDQAELAKAVKDAFAFEDTILLEEYIEGEEYTVAVVDGEAYPIVQITPIEGFYDYKNKYTAGSTIETCPAPLSEEASGKMQEIAVRAASVLDIKGYCRLDFMMDKQGKMYCLEANTLPGMTPTSLIPQEAAALGMDYPSLCEELIRVSLKNR